MKKHLKQKAPASTFQQSLDKWFPRTDKDGNLIESPYKIFYLTWYKNCFPIAVWQKDMPPKEKISYQTDMKWKDIQPDHVLIIGYFEEQQIQSQLQHQQQQQPQQQSYYYDAYYSNVAFLKSHLQKAIRRSQTDLALKTAKHFMQLDMTQFLRRLAIIMLEDVYLMTEFLVVVWLTAAVSKGFDLKYYQRNWLLSVVKKLAGAEWWDTTVSTNYHDKKNIEITKGDWKTWQLNFTGKITTAWDDLNEKDQCCSTKSLMKSLIYTLQFRKAFGGMSGDKLMIDNFTRIWFERFQKIKEDNSGTHFWVNLLFKQPDPDKEKLLIENIKPLALDEWIIPALDFHCLPNLLSILLDKFEEYEYNEIKETIWHLSSKYNNKKIDPSIKYNFQTRGLEYQTFQRYREIWSNIRPQFYGLAEFFLKHNY